MDQRVVYKVTQTPSSTIVQGISKSQVMWFHRMHFRSLIRSTDGAVYFRRHRDHPIVMLVYAQLSSSAHVRTWKTASKPNEDV